MDKWEYKRERINFTYLGEWFIDKLNELGNEGWEFVCHEEFTGFTLFKRKKLEE